MFGEGHAQISHGSWPYFKSHRKTPNVHDKEQCKLIYGKWPNSYEIIPIYELKYLNTYDYVTGLVQSIKEITMNDPHRIPTLRVSTFWWEEADNRQLN